MCDSEDGSILKGLMALDDLNMMRDEAHTRMQFWRNNSRDTANASKILRTQSRKTWTLTTTTIEEIFGSRFKWFLLFLFSSCLRTWRIIDWFNKMWKFKFFPLLFSLIRISWFFITIFVDFENPLWSFYFSFICCNILTQFWCCAVP